MDGNLYLAGNQPRAALYAVYSFLQNQLDVRWFWPGDDGEFLPALKQWNLNNVNYKFRPVFRFREMIPISLTSGSSRIAGKDTILEDLVRQIEIKLRMLFK